MRIFLTGGRGMVGQNFLEHPSASEHEIVAPTSQELDLRDFQSVLGSMSDCQPDIVIHAAGRVGGIQANLREPVAFLIDNLDMGRNIVLAARTANIPRVLNLGSSCMYPRTGTNPLMEDQVLKGELEPTNEGYALAKIMTARLCEYISREDPELHYKTLIPCNLYGRHDKFDPMHSHMVPAILHKLHQAKKGGLSSVNIWGDGLARREFMYAGDFADCMWRAISNFDSLPMLMNVGLGFDYTINEYYKAAAELIGYDGMFQHDLSKPVGMKQKLISVERATQWGWTSHTSLKVGLALTYAYYLKERKR